MAGTKAGGKKAAATNKAKNGEDFYARIGRKGGKAETAFPKGFATMPQWKRMAAGRKGGLVSSKNPTMTLAERRQEIDELLKQEEELANYETSF